MDLKLIERYLQIYLNDVMIPQINRELDPEGEEPINISIYKINLGEQNPNRLNFFLDIDPDWSGGSISSKLNHDLSRFVKMLGIEKNLHIYWNKRPLF
jgi:hypothetical protein